MIYEIAGLRVYLDNKSKYTDVYCKAYLSADQTSPVDVRATVTKEEFEEEKSHSEKFPGGYIENICLYRSLCRQIPALNRILLHSSVLSLDGNAYGFLGRSGTGKSTHTRLWMQYLDGVEIVNGDKPILECRDNTIFAYGTPWMGKEGWGKNTVVPLKGLCFLEQAPENSIVRLTNAQAVSRIFTQVFLPEDEEMVNKTLEFIDKLVESIPMYLLKCTISQDAVRCSYEALTGKQYEYKEIDNEN